ncbi:hypothetical protein E2C01_057273 [Portunus trituberculatus]|uniref:Uncharacterized protein n=1 Tax=Portunus trituberculatus TaxID=210409 RepID=A0A5B7GZV8_PORTR|nr:hypothetical protein [Portunus trituberculatus]
MSVAKANNKAINPNCRNIARLDKQISELASYTNLLGRSKPRGREFAYFETSCQTEHHPSVHKVLSRCSIYALEFASEERKMSLDRTALPVTNSSLERSCTKDDSGTQHIFLQ